MLVVLDSMLTTIVAIPYEPEEQQISSELEFLMLLTLSVWVGGNPMKD
jgi:hypothetical protein